MQSRIGLTAAKFVVRVQENLEKIA